jgi:hypothetical protein
MQIALISLGADKFIVGAEIYTNMQNKKIFPSKKLYMFVEHTYCSNITTPATQFP